ncbi:helix-turn-helix transcriptional regulator [Streptomyces tsukubensis]|uniref:helix-turn-helix domain-containing protein n=1 Tax=Streptomyces tsukubensis TaxID=83656 RepID=UPI00369DBE81
MYTRKQPRRNASALRLIGKLVALFRKEAGLTQEQLAEILGIGVETLASVEQGRRTLKVDYAEAMDEVLDTKGALAMAVQNMPEIDMIPAWAEQYMDMEQEAIALSFYENHVLPGLLQTPGYARALFRARVPFMSEERTEAEITARIERQQLLHRSEPTPVAFIFSEAVLMDRLGGSETFRTMLRHLRSSTELPGVTIQVMPLGTHGHAGLDGPFVLLETPLHQRLAYTETQRGSQLIGDADEVGILERKYAMLRTQALNQDETRRLLDRLLGE